MSSRTDYAEALIRGIVGTAGFRATQAVLGLVIAVILARVLGPSGYGAYSFVMALVAFLAIPSELGIPGLAVREVAVTNARSDWARLRGFIAWSHRNIAVLSLAIMLVCAIFMFALRHRIDPVRLQCMWLGLFLIPLVSLGALRSAMLQGLRKVLLGQLPELVIRPLALLVMIVALEIAGPAISSAAEVMGLQLVATTIAFAAGLYFFARNRPADLRKFEPFRDDALWWKSGLTFGLFAAMRMINGRTDILALGAFHSDAEVGVYRIAVQLATLIIFGLQIVNPIQGPHLAHIYATGDMQQFQRMVTKTSRIIFFITIPVVSIVVLFGQWIISIAFGEQFEAAYWPLVILAAGQLVNASMGSVGSVLNMTGHERDTATSIFAGAAVNIALNLLLTPQMGMIGAAIATSASLITWNMLMWRKVRIRLGIETSVFRWNRR